MEGGCLQKLSVMVTAETYMYSRFKIEPKTINLGMRLWGITTEYVGFIHQSLILRSIA